MNTALASHRPSGGEPGAAGSGDGSTRRRWAAVGVGVRRVGPLALPLIVLTVMQWIGTLASPALYDRWPLLLVFLSPRVPFLLYASSHSPLVAFVAVAALRSLAADPVNYCIGRRLGPGLYRRIEDRGGVARRVLLVSERVFDRCGVVAVAVRPNGAMLALAGSRRLNPVATGLAAVTGTVAYLTALALTAEAAANPMARFTSWAGRPLATVWSQVASPTPVVPAVAATVVVAAAALWGWSRSRQSEPALVPARTDA